MPKKNHKVKSIWDVLDKPTVYEGEMRKIVRPVIQKRMIFLSVVIRLLITGLFSFVASLGLSIVFGQLSTQLYWPGIFAVCALVSYFFLFLVSLRKILIFFVLVYQLKASDEVRMRCVFIPSCSDYMIISLKKYGVILGIVKGIKRLRRCRSNLSWERKEDYP